MNDWKKELADIPLICVDSDGDGITGASINALNNFKEIEEFVAVQRTKAISQYNKKLIKFLYRNAVAESNETIFIKFKKRELEALTEEIKKQ